jgi:hypothetical protein
LAAAERPMRPSSPMPMMDNQRPLMAWGSHHD